MSHTIWYLSSLSLYPTQIADIPAHTKVKKQFLYKGHELLAQVILVDSMLFFYFQEKISLFSLFAI